MDEAVKTAIEELRGYRDQHYEIAEYTSGLDAGAHYAMDFLTVAVLNRSLTLIRGFCDLVESRNFLVAVPLIRLQLDSCLRFSAAWYAPNLNEVANKILGGARIKDLRDRDGNKMHDSYLMKKLAVKYPWVSDVYENTSGYIHLSDRHIFNALHIADKEERIVLLKVGEEDAFVPQEAYLDAIEGFKAITVVLLGLVKAYGRLKRQSREPRVDKQQV